MRKILFINLLMFISLSMSAEDINLEQIKLVSGERILPKDLISFDFIPVPNTLTTKSNRVIYYEEIHEIILKKDQINLTIPKELLDSKGLKLKETIMRQLGGDGSGGG